MASSSAALPRGVFPTMITPFTADGKEVDYAVLDALTDWYIASGCTGLFAVCQSSEMYELSPAERLEVARRVVAKAAGRVPVVASGTFGGTMAEQAEFVKSMSKIVTAVVVLVNQVAGEDEPEETWVANAKELLALTGDIPLGLYECPKPYHRLLKPETLAWCAGTGRFLFHKDTCCVKAGIAAKLAALPADCPFAFYNANAATLKYSLELGGAGFSGISANFYPQLLAWLCSNPSHPEADHVQDFLAVVENVVMYKYPTSAKMFLAILAGSSLPITPACRAVQNTFSEEETTKLGALRSLVANLCARIDIDIKTPAL
eukprot:m.16489 g.16489  ORF g.16489 m.16489 type:complete len:318 (+) comp5264_c0_seq1:1892-2845(+)